MLVIADTYISYTELYGPKYVNTGGDGVGRGGVWGGGGWKKIRLN